MTGSGQIAQLRDIREVTVRDRVNSSLAENIDDASMQARERMNVWPWLELPFARRIW